MDKNGIPDLSSLAFNSSDVADMSGQNIATFSSIEGRLPKHDIHIIKVRSNNLQKFDKDFFMKHKSIKYLDVSDNEIQDLNGIELLEDLVLLDCSKNFVSRLSNLEKCANLKRLLISSNEITSVFLKSAVPRLVVLDLHKNLIKRIDFGKYFPTVSELYVDGCQLTSINGIQDFPSLKHFTAKNNQIYDVDNVTSSTLADVDLMGNKISKLNFIMKFPNLVFINIANNPITDKSLEGIKPCPSVRALRISKTDITRTAPFLIMVPNIELVELDDTKINDYIDILQYVKNAKKLRLLSLRNTPLTKNLYNFKDTDVDKKWTSLEEYQKERGVNEELTKYRQGILDCGQMIEILDTIIVSDQEILNGTYEYEESLHEVASDEYENEEEDHFYNPLPLQPMSQNFSENETAEFSTQTEKLVLQISKPATTYEIKLKELKLQQDDFDQIYFEPIPKSTLSISRSVSKEIPEKEIRLRSSANDVFELKPKEKYRVMDLNQVFMITPLPKKERHVVCLSTANPSIIADISPKIRTNTVNKQDVFAFVPPKKVLSQQSDKIFENEEQRKINLSKKSDEVFDFHVIRNMSKNASEIFTQEAKKTVNLSKFNANIFQINEKKQFSRESSQIFTQQAKRTVKLTNFNADLSIKDEKKKLTEEFSQMFTQQAEKPVKLTKFNADIFQKNEMKQLSKESSNIFTQKAKKAVKLSKFNSDIFDKNVKQKALTKTSSSQVFEARPKKKSKLSKHSSTVFDKAFRKPQIGFTSVSFEVSQQEEPKIDINKLDIEKRDKIIRKLMKKNEELQATISQLSVDKGADYQRQIDEYVRKIKHLKQSQEKHLIEIGILRERTRSQSQEIEKLISKIPSNDAKSMTLIEKMFNAVESQNQFLVKKVSSIKPQIVESGDKSILLVIDNLLKQNRTLHNEIIRSTLEKSEESTVTESELELSPKKTHRRKKPIDSRIIARQWMSQTSSSEITESDSISYSYLPSEYVLRKKSHHQSKTQVNPFGLSADAPLWNPDKYSKPKMDPNPSYSISSYN